MQKNYSQLFLGIIIGLLLGLGIAKVLMPKSATTPIANNTVTNTPTNNKPSNNSNNNPTDYNNNNNRQTEPKASNGAIPQKVYEVLQYIKANGTAKEGYVGGRTFTNREKILPKTTDNGQAISYQEWDVNPKRQGQNRGAERIVTGSDNRSWYTSDHYKSFTQIK
jgi:guanyl-specific ribonuclease Sa